MSGLKALPQGIAESQAIRAPARSSPSWWPTSAGLWERLQPRRKRGSGLKALPQGRSGVVLFQRHFDRRQRRSRCRSGEIPTVALPRRSLHSACGSGRDDRAEVLPWRRSPPQRKRLSGLKALSQGIAESQAIRTPARSSPSWWPTSAGLWERLQPRRKRGLGLKALPQGRSGTALSHRHFDRRQQRSRCRSGEIPTQAGLGAP